MSKRIWLSDAAYPLRSKETVADTSLSRSYLGWKCGHRAPKRKRFSGTGFRTPEGWGTTSNSAPSRDMVQNRFFGAFLGSKWPKMTQIRKKRKFCFKKSCYRLKGCIRVKKRWKQIFQIFWTHLTIFRVILGSKCPQNDSNKEKT